MADAVRTIKRQLDQEVNRIITEFRESIRSNAKNISNTIKTVSSVQTATLLTSIETNQDQHAQAMLYALQALPSLYYQRLRSLRQPNTSATATTAISVPLQPQIIHPLQENEQSNQATLPQEDYIDEMEDNDMGTAGQESPLTRQLDAMNMSEDLVQVTPDVAPQQPPMQIQPILPSDPLLSLDERLDMLAVEVAESRYIIEFDVSDGFTYEMVSRSRPLKEHWEEWFYGLTRDGVQQPSIYWLNGNQRHHTFANSHIADTAWRYVDPGKDRNIYNALWTFKKAIVRGILKVMLDLEGDIMYRERTALAEVAALIQHNNVTLNQFQRKNRKN
ncbi:hypothetical protein BGX21_006771 [Mortierella sp. AD011]|nr:hypothetical protein BGX21_006771 [Mortierella sp. AD011]